MRKRVPIKVDAPGQYFDEGPDVEFFSSGCCLLDNALSANGKGWAERVVNIVGDKAVGKSLVACEAAANYLEKYPKRAVWYREVEAAFDFDYVASLGIPVDRFDFKSDFFTVEDVFEDLSSLIEKKKKGLYIIDSLDALSDRKERDMAIDKGTFGTSKAKTLSALFRRLTQKLRHSQITVMIISQLRDKIGVTFGEREERTGGRALDFYASQVIWLSQIKTLRRTVQGVERPVGIMVRAKVKKNKVGPPFREAEFPLLFNYGVEDVFACAEWLAEVKRLKEANIAKEYDRLTNLAALARMDQEEYNQWRSYLRKKTRLIWKNVEQSFLPTRRKYG